MKKLLIISIIIALIAVAAILFWQLKGKTGPEDRLSLEISEEDLIGKYYIYGKIYDISQNRILIAEGIEGDSYRGDINELRGDAIWFATDERTKIKDRDGRVIFFSDLAIGEQAEAWADSMVLEGYPAQAVALKINLLERSDYRLDADENDSIPLFEVE